MDDLDDEVAGFDEFLEIERGSVERVGELADRAAQALVPSVRSRKSSSEAKSGVITPMW